MRTANYNGSLYLCFMFRYLFFTVTFYNPETSVTIQTFMPSFMFCYTSFLATAVWFLYLTPVKEISSILFLAVQYNFDNFLHLYRFLTLSVASVRLWDLWVWPRSISPLSLHSGHIGGPLFQSCSGVAVTPKTLQGKEDGSLFYSTLSQASPFACCLCTSQTSNILFIVISATACW